jgi:hypothetical protein
MNGATHNRSKYASGGPSNEITFVPLVLPTINSPGRKKSTGSVNPQLNNKNNSNFKKITGH